MFLAYFMIFASLSASAQIQRPVEVIPNPQSYEDFEHQNKGCPENSECDQVMGLQLTRWKELVKKLKRPEVSSAQKAKELEAFRSKYGIPVEFYTNHKSQQGFKPLYFNSPCKEHNPKKEDQRILKGIAFLKSLPGETGVVWRDQAVIEVPTKELLIPQPVQVYYPEGIKEYYLPLGDQPLYIKDKSLIVLKEDDDLFYALKVSPKGEWEIIDLDFTRLSEWEDKRENVACPKEKNSTPGVFGVEFCKNVWDEELKKTVVVKMHQGCST